MVLACATTIDKSQGSEYPAVVIPLSTQHYPMLQLKDNLEGRSLRCRGVATCSLLVGCFLGQPKCASGAPFLPASACR